MNPERQYLDLAAKIVDHGVDVFNARTGKSTRTIIGHTLTYDCSTGLLPVLTTRKVAWRVAIAEMLGYLRGYDSAAQFRAIGCNTWNANANENAAWLANPSRRGTDDMGRVYGVQGRRWRSPSLRHSGGCVKVFDQLRKVYDDLKRGVDDRGEIITYWNPGEMNEGCLRPCMHTFQFSLLDGRLYLEAYQRSIDVPLGLVFNMIQVAWFLMIMAQITGTKPAIARHHLTNCHIYGDQLDLMRQQLRRGTFKQPRLVTDPNTRSLEDLENWVMPDDFDVEGYKHHAPIKYPFSV